MDVLSWSFRVRPDFCSSAWRTRLGRPSYFHVIDTRQRESAMLYVHFAMSRLGYSSVRGGVAKANFPASKTTLERNLMWRCSNDVYIHMIDVGIR